MVTFQLWCAANKELFHSGDSYYIQLYCTGDYHYGKQAFGQKEGDWWKTSQPGKGSQN